MGHTQINKHDLDRYITGNYGEDQFRGLEEQPEINLDVHRRQLELFFDRVNEIGAGERPSALTRAIVEEFIGGTQGELAEAFDERMQYLANAISQDVMKFFASVTTGLWKFRKIADPPHDADCLTLCSVPFGEKCRHLHSCSICNADDAEETCIECGDHYPAFGDGYAGRCPTCADRHEYSRGQ